MFITGYQTQDLILKPAFQRAAIEAIEALAHACAKGPALAIGGPAVQEGVLYNGYYILQGGKITATVLKHHLPNDAVFDERRVFASADVHGPYMVNGVRIGSPICEDAWHADVAETLAETGAEILLVPTGSPYHRGKPNLRLNLMVSRVVETELPLVYLNMVGGQDDQVFDGSSMVLNRGGHLALQLPQWPSSIRPRWQAKRPSRPPPFSNLAPTSPLGRRLFFYRGSHARCDLFGIKTNGVHQLRMRHGAVCIFQIETGCSDRSQRVRDLGGYRFG